MPELDLEKEAMTYLQKSLKEFANKYTTITNFLEDLPNINDTDYLMECLLNSLASILASTDEHIHKCQDLFENLLTTAQGLSAIHNITKAIAQRYALMKILR